MRTATRLDSVLAIAKPVLLAAALCFPGVASGQLDVSLSLGKDTFLLYEGVQATVEIRNLAGSDVVLGGSSAAQPWITFDVTGGGGTTMAPYTSKGFEIEPTVLKAGQAVTKKVVLNRRYTLAERGSYVVKANVYFPPLNRYISTRPRRFTVDEGRVFWERVVGVKGAVPGSTEFKRFVLLAYQGSTSAMIYFRLKDEESGRTRTTYPLGKTVMHRNPQAVVDSESRLHVLFMGAPKTYGHVIVGSSGRIASREIYREIEGDRPTLMQADDGTVAVSGGTFFDPENPQFAEQSGAPPGVRRLSERPEGWSGIGSLPGQTTRSGFPSR